MLTVDDIKYVSFRRANIGGYKPEDVDAFIDDVQLSYEKLLEEKTELEKKIQILADKVKQYRSEEDCIKDTLINAQKLSDASIKEAKIKADSILKEAKMKADKLSENTKNETIDAQNSLNKLKKEAAKFRTDLLKIYKEHLKLIDALPTEEDLKAKEGILEGSIGKVKEEVHKVIKKIPDISSQKSSDKDSDDKHSSLHQGDGGRIQNKFIDLKFGKKYKLNEDN